jgi:hypothetical protein
MDGRRLTTAVRDVTERDDPEERDNAGTRARELVRRWRWEEGLDCEAYNTPMLMATSAPIFSFLLIATFQTIFHGRRESRISSAPE